MEKATCRKIWALAAEFQMVNGSLDLGATEVTRGKAI
jgi:hypothetical protein